MPSQLIDEKISLLEELLNVKNKPEVNKTYHAQIDIIRSINDYEIENVEGIIKQKRNY